MTAFVIIRGQNLSQQSIFLIKLYQPKENTRVVQISQKIFNAFYVQLLAFLTLKDKYSSFFRKNVNNRQVTAKLIALN